MPWLRLGDNAATYPKLMQIAGYPGADERAVREVFGWLVSCAAQSAGHLTDYLIDPGTANMLAGSPARAKVLVRWCTRAGLVTPMKIDGVTHWSILEDPEFIHIRTRAEVEWDRQRQADVANVALIVPVRLRDGDNCRYCGVQVQWRGRKSNRSAEYDHRRPGEAATLDTLVVACRSCNGARKANAHAWDDRHPLRPAPTHPFYGDITADFLTLNGYPTTPNLEPSATRRADTAADQARTAARPAAGPEHGDGDDTAANRASAATPPPFVDQPESVTSSPAEVPAEVPPNSTSHSLGTGSPGSGRDGPGPGPGPDRTRARSRGRRGARRRPPGTQPPAPRTDPTQRTPRPEEQQP